MDGTQPFRPAPIERRDFLKLSGAACLALSLAPAQVAIPPSPEPLGRVNENGIYIYRQPSFQAAKVRQVWKDMVLPIADVTVGDEQPAFNRVWYRIGDDGFIHSGSIQPVMALLNPEIAEISPAGALAEVTVPFTDAHRGAARNFPVAYRYYYETTHWVLGLKRDASGRGWYHVLEDKWDDEYYVPAAHLRLIPDDELKPLSPDLPAREKRIEVHTDNQLVIAYERNRPVFMARAATGAIFSNGDFSTPPGRHLILRKRPSRHMAAGNLAFNGYDLPGVPWITYFTESGISFHGTYWHNNFGRKRSHGCINLTAKAARWIFRWTLPAVPAGEHEVFDVSGTVVDVLS